VEIEIELAKRTDNLAKLVAATQLTLESSIRHDPQDEWVVAARAGDQGRVCEETALVEACQLRSSLRLIIEAVAGDFAFISWLASNFPPNQLRNSDDTQSRSLWHQQLCICPPQGLRE
jgi:hypothetical protein